jgi:hypothetical protein
MINPLIHRLMDVIEAAAFKDADDEFVAHALALFALSISRLPPEKREEILQGIEVGGALTTAVNQFHPPYQRKPRHPDGRGRLQ